MLLAVICLILFMLFGFFSIHNAFKITIDLWPLESVMVLPFPLVLASIFVLGLLLGGILQFFYTLRKKLKDTHKGAQTRMGSNKTSIY